MSMKTNAPEKIYVYIPDDDIVGTASIQKGFPHQFVTEEYTRTDAFIEKAVEWLKKNIEDYMYVLYDKDGRPTNNVRVATLCFEDFKNYMKGE